MPNDVITLSAAVRELQSTLAGGRIEKIYQPETDEITLSVKVARKASTLVISANPSHPRIHITTQKKENSYTAPAFCMLLRKYLSGGFIESVEIFNSDRIVKISVINKNELKDSNRFFLMAELMGRYSNVILTTESFKIIDAIRRIHFDQSTTRYILPNLEYTLQPKSRISLDETEKADDFFRTAEINADSIIKNINGVSKETAKEIASSDSPGDKFKELLNINDSDSYQPCLRYENGVLKDYYVYPYSSINGTYKPYPDLNSALDAFFGLYDGNERKKASTKTVTTVLKRLQSKTDRRIADNLAKLEESDKAAYYQKCGELILSNIYAIKPRDLSLVCYDYYENATTEIPLDPSLSPSANAQQYFRKYAKLKRAAEIATTQLEALKEQKEYLESVAVSINNCSLKSEYDEILEELNSLSGLRNPLKKRNLKEKPTGPTRFVVDGFNVYLGKNNLQNNEVTFSVGDGGDTWLHVKAHHGAHVVIKGRPTAEVIEKCARVAAFYSSAKTSEKVEVDYTLRKNVRKIPSAMPGMVTYVNYRSILVSPTDYTEICDK